MDVQVIVLDRHAPADARVDRHCGTLLRNDISTIRIRASRPEEKIHRDGRFFKENGVVELVPIKQLPSPLQLIAQQLMFLFPILMHTIYPFTNLIDMERDENTILHVHDPELLGLAKLLQKKHFSSAQIVYDRHEIFEKAGGLYGFVSTFFEKLNAHSVKGVVGISQIYDAGNKKIFPRALVTSVPNYPLFGEYDHSAIEKKISDFNEDSEILLSYIGSLNQDYDRDIYLLLDILEMALKSNENVRVLVAGKTSSKDLRVKFNELEERYGCRFQYPGYISREKTKEITERSHLGFFLLRPESIYWVKSSPNKFYEYLATGNVAVIRADIDVDITPGSVLMYDRWTKREEIIDAVISLLEQPEKLKNMMRSAHRQGNMYTYENVESRYLELYGSVFSPDRNK